MAAAAPPSPDVLAAEAYRRFQDFFSRHDEFRRLNPQAIVRPYKDSHMLGGTAIVLYVQGLRSLSDAVGVALRQWFDHPDCRVLVRSDGTAEFTVPLEALLPRPPPKRVGVVAFLADLTRPGNLALLLFALATLFGAMMFAFYLNDADKRTLAERVADWVATLSVDV